MSRARGTAGTREVALRRQLAQMLEWGDAHVSFDDVVRGVPPALRGRRARGLPWSLWELLEHLRLAQRDILDFCRDPHYRERKWPEAYWPPVPEPPNRRAWSQSVAVVRSDREAMKALALDPKLDLLARIPHGSGQTCLREILLSADHGAYHIGQMVAVRRALGCWSR